MSRDPDAPIMEQCEHYHCRSELANEIMRAGGSYRVSRRVMNDKVPCRLVQTLLPFYEPLTEAARLEKQKK